MTKNQAGVDMILGNGDDISVDGPDGNTTESQYLPELDAPAMDALRSPQGSRGIRRTDYTESTETDTGGNNQIGHQETSENHTTAFEEVSAANPPNPGQP